MPNSPTERIKIIVMLFAFLSGNVFSLQPISAIDESAVNNNLDLLRTPEINQLAQVNPDLLSTNISDVFQRIKKQDNAEVAAALADVAGVMNVNSAEETQLVIDSLDAKIHEPVFGSGSLSENSGAADSLRKLEEANIIDFVVDKTAWTVSIADPTIKENLETSMLETMQTQYQVEFPQSDSTVLKISKKLLNDQLVIDDAASLDSGSGENAELEKESTASEKNTYIEYSPFFAEKRVGTFAANKILYSEVWPGVDVLNTSVPNGIKEDIIVKNNQAPTEFLYAVKTKGLVAQLTGQNKIEYVDWFGNVEMYIPAPKIIDALGNEYQAQLKLLSKKEAEAWLNENNPIKKQKFAEMQYNEASKSWVPKEIQDIQINQAEIFPDSLSSSGAVLQVSEKSGSGAIIIQNETDTNNLEMETSSGASLGSGQSLLEELNEQAEQEEIRMKNEEISNTETSNSGANLQIELGQEPAFSDMLEKADGIESDLAEPTEIIEPINPEPNPEALSSQIKTAANQELFYKSFWNKIVGIFGIPTTYAENSATAVVNSGASLTLDSQTENSSGSGQSATEPEQQSPEVNQENLENDELNLNPIEVSENGGEFLSIPKDETIQFGELLETAEELVSETSSGDNILNETINADQELIEVPSSMYFLLLAIPEEIKPNLIYPIDLDPSTLVNFHDITLSQKWWHENDGRFSELKKILKLENDPNPVAKSGTGWTIGNAGIEIKPAQNAFASNTQIEFNNDFDKGFVYKGTKTDETTFIPKFLTENSTQVFDSQIRDDSYLAYPSSFVDILYSFHEGDNQLKEVILLEKPLQAFTGFSALAPALDQIFKQENDRTLYTFSWEISRPDKFSLYRNSDGEVLVKDENNKSKLKIDSLFYLDSVNQKHTENIHWQLDDNAEISQTTLDTKHTLTLVIENPLDAEFPIMIDPTIAELGLTTDLVGYWKMDNNWNDSSSNGNNGTGSGSIAFSDSGKFSQAGNFDGSDDHVEIANESSFDFERSNSFSIGAWIKTAYTTADQVIVSKMNNTSPFAGYEMRLTGSGALNFSLTNTQDSNWLAETSETENLNNNAWHYIAVTYDGSSGSSGLKFYIDGSLAATTVGANSLSASVLNDIAVNIGRRTDLNTNRFNGLLDDVAIWSRALSADEIEGISGCQVDRWFTGGICADVTTGYYSPANDNSRYECSNKPAHSTYADSGNGTNNCPYICDTGYSGADCTDTTAPTITSVTTSSPACSTIRFTVNGASDNGSGLHATPYSFDNGSNWQADNYKDFSGTGHTILANQIKVKDTDGNQYTYASEASDTAVACNQAPNVPTLVTPENEVVTSDSTPTLSAHYSDPDANDIGTTNYRIATGSGQNCLDNVNVVGSGTSAITSTNSADTTWTPTSSIGADATYYWCAQNNDGEDTSAWTSMGSFMLNTVFDVLEATSGNNQVGGLNEQLTGELKVRVGTGSGSYAGAGDVTVTFAIDSVPSTPSAFGQVLTVGTFGQNVTGSGTSTMTIKTDANGYASVLLKLGDRAGTYTVTADFSGNTSGVKTFTAVERKIMKILTDNIAVNLLSEPNAENPSADTCQLDISTNASSYVVTVTPNQWPTKDTKNIANWGTSLGFGWDDNDTQPTPIAFSSSGGNPAETTIKNCSGDACQGTLERDLDWNVRVDYLPEAGSYSNSAVFGVKEVGF